MLRRFSKITFAIIIIALVISFACLSRLDYSDRMDGYTDGTPEGVEEYMVHNYWPKGSPFYEERFGLINHNTGVETKAIYKDWLEFYFDDITWDYDGHYVDGNGNIVIDCSYVLESSYFTGNPKKLAWNTLFSLDHYYWGTIAEFTEYCQNYLDTKYFGSSGLRTNMVGDFSSNGLAQFNLMQHDERGMYYFLAGFIDRNGNIVIPAQYLKVRDFDDNGYAIVYNGDYGIINSTGETVLDIQYDYIDHEYIDGELCYELNNGDIILNSKLEVIKKR